ncbi:MAG: hypothetical protein ACP5M5_08595 [Acidibrevibacterium sp.]|uniref:hypothetical protein n=1 Tax=Acidibrevibacterium sp. TaxID=2606776 RepID=UPI003D082F0D
MKMLTSNTTLDILLQERRLAGYEPRLRFDQQPERLVFLRPACLTQIKALPDAPQGENPVPVPREQIMVLLDDFCAGTALVSGYDFEKRGQRLFLLKTRSVRAGAMFLSKTELVVLDVQPKAAFNPAKGGPLKNAAWYRACCALPEFKELSPFALRDPL